MSPPGISTAPTEPKQVYSTLSNCNEGGAQSSESEDSTYVRGKLEELYALLFSSSSSGALYNVAGLLELRTVLEMTCIVTKWR